MVRLMCPHCRLSYAGAMLPQYLAASAGASCPRCATPLMSSNDNAQLAARPRRRLSAQQRHEPHRLDDGQRAWSANARLQAAEV